MAEVSRDNSSYLSDIKQYSEAIQKKPENALREFNVLTTALDQLPKTYKTSTLPKIAQKLLAQASGKPQKESKTLTSLFDKVHEQVKSQIKSDPAAARQTVAHLIMYDPAHRQSYHTLLSEIANVETEQKKAEVDQKEREAEKRGIEESIEGLVKPVRDVLLRNTLKLAFFDCKEESKALEVAQDIIGNLEDSNALMAYEQGAFTSFEKIMDNPGSLTVESMKNIKEFFLYVVGNAECHERLLKMLHGRKDTDTLAVQLITKLVEYGRAGEQATESTTETEALRTLVDTTMHSIEKAEQSGAKDVITFSSYFKEQIKTMIGSQKDMKGAIQIAEWALQLQTSKTHREEYEKAVFNIIEQGLSSPQDVTDGDRYQVQCFATYALGNSELYSRLHDADALREKTREKAQKQAVKENKTFVTTDDTRWNTYSENLIMTIAKDGMEVLASGESLEGLNSRRKEMVPLFAEMGEVKKKEEALDVSATATTIISSIDEIKKTQALKGVPGGASIEAQMERVCQACLDLNYTSYSAQSLEQWVAALEQELETLNKLTEPHKILQKQIQGLQKQLTEPLKKIQDLINAKKSLEEKLIKESKKTALFQDLKEVGLMEKGSDLYSEIEYISTWIDSEEDAVLQHGDFFGVFSQEPFSTLRNMAKEAYAWSETLGVLVKKYVDYEGGQVLFKDNEIYNSIYSKKSFASKKSLLDKDFWKQVARLGKGEWGAFFSLRPFAIGNLVHPSVVNVQQGMLKETDIDAEFQNSDLSFDSVIQSRCFSPSIDKLITKDGWDHLRRAFPGKSDKEIVQQINYRFSVVMSKILEDKDGEFSKITNKTLRMVASILPRLPSLKKRSKDEAAEFSDRMFCSEFMALVLERSIEMVNKDLHKMAGGDTSVKFFHSLIPRHKELKSIHPGKLAKLMTAKDIFEEKEPPLMQLLFKKPPRSE